MNVLANSHLIASKREYVHPALFLIHTQKTPYSLYSPSFRPSFFLYFCVCDFGSARYLTDGATELVTTNQPLFNSWAFNCCMLYFTPLDRACITCIAYFVTFVSAQASSLVFNADSRTLRAKIVEAALLRVNWRGVGRLDKTRVRMRSVLLFHALTQKVRLITKLTFCLDSR